MTNTAEQVEVSTERLVEEATELGQEHGRSSGTWVDGWTQEGAAHCLQLAEDGDPMWAEMWGASPPLSGEWADGMTERRLIEDELRIEWDSLTEAEVEEVVSAYEDGFYDGHDEEVLRQARIHAEPEVRHTTCHNCELDVEVWSDNPTEARDRGNNTHCPSGERHVASD